MALTGGGGGPVLSGRDKCVLIQLDVSLHPNPLPLARMQHISLSFLQYSSRLQGLNFWIFEKTFPSTIKNRTMAFGDLSGAAGLKKLNEHLRTRSYIEGYQPSQSDTAAFDQIKSTPNAKDYIYVLRWFNHIKRFGDLRKKFPGAAPSAAAKPSSNDDDEVDLFGSDEEEDAEAAKIKEQRLAEYAAKKEKKGPGPIAKSSIVLDVKPWDDETDMKQLEAQVRTIAMDGLVWGASKLVPVGYGINKLQIMCVVEDEKVSIDLLQEEIQNFEDFVQSVDIAAFNKI